MPTNENGADQEWHPVASGWRLYQATATEQRDGTLQYLHSALIYPMEEWKSSRRRQEAGGFGRHLKPIRGSAMQNSTAADGGQTVACNLPWPIEATDLSQPPGSLAFGEL
jgi:hypothetical protein